MRKTYQGTQDKSKQKFEVIGKRELLAEVPLPMIESLESTILVPPGWQARMNDDGFVLLTRMTQ